MMSEIKDKPFTITIGSKTYPIKCLASEQKPLLNSAALVSQELANIRKQNPLLSESKCYLTVSLNLAKRYLKAQDDLTQISQSLDLLE